MCIRDSMNIDQLKRMLRKEEAKHEKALEKVKRAKNERNYRQDRVNELWKEIEKRKVKKAKQ